MPPLSLSFSPSPLFLSRNLHVRATLTTRKTAGIFTANVAGVYIVSTQVRVAGVDEGESVRAAIVQDVTVDPNEFDGRMAMRFGVAGTSGIYGLTVAGVFQLSVGDTLGVVVATDDTDYRLEQETVFSAVLIQTSAAFASSTTGFSITGQSGAWVELRLPATDPDDTNRRNNFAVADGETAWTAGTNDLTGRFTVANAGMVFVSANVMISGATEGNFAVGISVNGAPNSEGNPETAYTHISGTPPSTGGGDDNRLNFQLSGVLWLGAGDFVQLWVSGEPDTYNILAGSGFTGSVLEGTEGFAVKAADDVTFTDQTGEWVEVAAYGADYGAAGLFVSTSGLDLTTGRGGVRKSQIMPSRQVNVGVKRRAIFRANQVRPVAAREQSNTG